MTIIPSGADAQHILIVAVIVLAVLASAIALSYFQRKRDRIAAQRAALWVWRAAIAVSALAISSFRYTGTTASFVEAVGYFVGLASGGIAMREYFTRSSRKLKVVFLAKANNGFTQMISSGARERLTKHEAFNLIEIYPEPEAVETSLGVLEKVHAGELDQADAAILVLGEVTDELQLQVKRLIERGTQIVICDANVDRAYFYERNVEPPSFVGTDFIEGGRVVGRAINSRWAPGDVIVVLCGPNFNGPAYERAREALYTLEEQNSERDIWTVFTTAWSSAHLIEKLEKQVVPRLAALAPLGETSEQVPPRRTVHIFCGNDESAIIFSQWIMTRGLDGTYHFRLYGFDGLRNSQGELSIRAWPNIIFTVDTQPSRLLKKSDAFADEA